MNTKKSLKKIFFTIILLLFSFIIMPQSISQAENLEIDEDYLSNIIQQYLSSEEYKQELKNLNNTVYSDEKFQEFVNILSDDTAAEPRQKMIDTFTQAYESSTKNTEKEKAEDALIQTLQLFDTNVTNESVKSIDANSDTDESGGVLDTVLDIGGDVLNGLVGVIFYGVKLIPLMAARILMSIVGLAINGTESLKSGLQLDSILFNDIPILGINFFEQVSGGENANLINQIREQIAIWYVAIRNIAAVILSIIVLYVGIRMAISSVAEDKAKYKKMLTDWVVSLVLLFVLHYIMILIININDAIVDILKAARKTAGNSATVMDVAFDRAMSPTGMLSFTAQMAYTAIYTILAVMTFIFFCTYVMRMIKIAFLIMIAPLITVTYSIDRMGDGKSQALNTWFKNFVYNILLQPFHCIIYLSLVQTSLNAMSIDNLSSIVISIIMVIFMYEAEDIIKEIFHFQGKSVAKTIAQAALVTTAISSLTKAAASKAGNIHAFGDKGGGTTNNKTAPVTNNNAGQNNMNGGNAGVNPSSNNTPTGNANVGNTNVGNSGQDPNNGNASQYDALKNIRSKAGGLLLKGAGQIGKLPLAIMLGAAGAATGNMANAMSGFNSGMDISNNFLSGLEEKSNLRNFAKQYNNLVGENGQNIYAGQDDEWIRKHTKDLLNGDVEAQDYEKDYYKLLKSEQDRYIGKGLSLDDATTQIEQNVAGVQKGAISEVSAIRRFRGNIKSRFSKKSSNNASGNINYNNSGNYNASEKYDNPEQYDDSGDYEDWSEPSNPGDNGSGSSSENGEAWPGSDSSEDGEAWPGPYDSGDGEAWPGPYDSGDGEAWPGPYDSEDGDDWSSLYDDNKDNK